VFALAVLRNAGLRAMLIGWREPMNERAAEYRTKLDEARGRGGARWRTPAALRDEITVWAREVRAEGYSLGAVARAIGLSQSALGRWMSEQEQAGGLRRVRVAGEDRRVEPGTVVIVTPAGYRLEGLSLDDAVNVLRRL
jgi:hypothetical protein